MLTSLLQSLVKNWWVFALRGVMAIAFGVLAFARPDFSLAALVALFGAYALVDGIVMLAASPELSGTRYLGWALADGCLGIAAGVLTLLYPGATAIGLLYLLGAWLVVGGLGRIGLAIEMRKEIHNEWFIILGGILSVAAGALTFYAPIATALAWMWVIGFYAITYGVSMVGVGIKLHQLGSHLPKPNSTRPNAA